MWKGGVDYIVDRRRKPKRKPVSEKVREGRLKNLIKSILEETEKDKLDLDSVIFLLLRLRKVKSKVISLLSEKWIE